MDERRILPKCEFCLPRDRWESVISSTHLGRPALLQVLDFRKTSPWSSLGRSLSDDPLKGEKGDDIIGITNAANNDSITVDGGKGYDVLDLSDYSSSSVTTTGSTLTIDLGNSQSFDIDVKNIEQIITSSPGARLGNAENSCLRGLKTLLSSKARGRSRAFLRPRVDSRQYEKRTMPVPGANQTRRSYPDPR